MRICLVSSEYPPFSGGGIGTYTNITSRALAEAGHEVHVIANAWTDRGTNHRAALEHVDASGRLHVHRIPALNNQYGPCPPHDQPFDPLGTICRQRECSLYWSLRVAERLTELHKEFNIDVVEYPECFAEAYVALARRRAPGGLPDLPTTITLHSPIREIAQYNLLQHTAPWVERRGVIEDHAILLADTVSSPSRLLGTMVYRRLGLDTADKPFMAIPNSMDFDHIAGLATDGPRASIAPPRLLFVGRLEPRKGVRQLVDAAVALMSDHPDLIVELIGKDCPAGDEPGSMRIHLRSRIPSHLQKQFVFRDKIPRDALFARFETAAACIFAPQWDNFPYTCCEAMAAGGCVVVSDNSGMAEMVEHDLSGLVVRAGDPLSLQTAIARVLGEPGLADRLRSGAGPRIRDLCSPERIVPIKLDFYRETVDRHRQAAKARQLMTVTDQQAGETVALLVRDRDSEEALAATIRSVTIAARRAHLTPEITIVDSNRQDALNALFPHAVIDRPTDNDIADGSVERWLEQVRNSDTAFLMTMHAGETVSEEYLETITRVMASDEKIAWATTWALPVDGLTAEPYAGFDFTVPLEMMYYHPVPFAVIRRSHFEAVGGWNLDLQAGWREWDLWLAFLSHEFRGVVVPVWQARHHPDSGRPLAIEHGKAYEMTLEAIVERNRELFREHGATLWIADRVDRTAPPVVDFPGERPPAIREEDEAAESGLGPTRQTYHDLILNLPDAEVEAPEGHVGEAAFFSAHPLGGRTLLAHPPAHITFRDVDIAERSFLNLTLSMHPDVYSQEGGGVRFTVRIDGRQVLDESIDPKREPTDRGWKDVSIDLAAFAGAERIIQLETAAQPEDDIRFCTAGWGRAHLAADPFAPPPEKAKFVLRGRQ